MKYIILFMISSTFGFFVYHRAKRNDDDKMPVISVMMGCAFVGLVVCTMALLSELLAEYIAMLGGE